MRNKIVEYKPFIYKLAYCVYIILLLECRFSEEESKLGLNGLLVRHGGVNEHKGVPAMLERLYELPEGKDKHIIGLSLIILVCLRILQLVRQENILP